MHYVFLFILVSNIFPPPFISVPVLLPVPVRVLVCVVYSIVLYYMVWYCIVLCLCACGYGSVPAWVWSCACEGMGWVRVYARADARPRPCGDGCRRGWACGFGGRVGGILPAPLPARAAYLIRHINQSVNLCPF